VGSPKLAQQAGLRESSAFTRAKNALDFAKKLDDPQDVRPVGACQAPLKE